MGRVSKFLALAVFAILSSSTDSSATTSPQTFTLKLERGSRLTIAAGINGHPLSALLDSAAEATIVDRQLAKQLNLGHGESVSGQGSGKASFEAQLVNGVTLEALDLRLENQTVAVADLSDVGRRLLHHRVDAILGREIFDAARLSIDIEGGHIAVIGRDLAPRGARLDLVTEQGIETVAVRIESGEPVRATFDLGNGSHVLVSAALAKRLRFLSDGRKVVTERGGGLGGETDRQVFQLRELEIAGRKFANLEASVDPNPSASDVNIGVSVLRYFLITTDFSQHAVWLEPRT